MGLFSFVKTAGNKIFGGASDEVAKQTKITEFVTDLGLGVQNFSPTVKGETVCLEGECTSFEEKEKIVLAVGNLDGIESIDDQLTVPGVEENTAANFYTVQSGDTLGKIAKDFYSDPSKYPVIFEANKPMLSHPDKIYPGQTLRIPTIS